MATPGNINKKIRAIAGDALTKLQDAAIDLPVNEDAYNQLITYLSTHVDTKEVISTVKSLYLEAEKRFPPKFSEFKDYLIKSGAVSEKAFNSVNNSNDTILQSGGIRFGLVGILGALFGIIANPSPFNMSREVATPFEKAATVFGQNPLNSSFDAVAFGKNFKKVYHKKALAAHPDKGGSSEALNELADAYEVLQGHYGTGKGAQKGQEDFSEQNRLTMKAVYAELIATIGIIALLSLTSYNVSILPKKLKFISDFVMYTPNTIASPALTALLSDISDNKMPTAGPPNYEIPDGIEPRTIPNGTDHAPSIYRFIIDDNVEELAEFTDNFGFNNLNIIIDNNNNTALQIAIKKNKNNIAYFIIKNLEQISDTNDYLNNINSLGESALTLACGLGQMGNITYLLQKPGIEVNIQNALGLTPLLQICMLAREKNIWHNILKQLLDLGADFTSVQLWGQFTSVLATCVLPSRATGIKKIANYIIWKETHNPDKSLIANPADRFISHRSGILFEAINSRNNVQQSKIHETDAFIAYLLNETEGKIDINHTTKVYDHKEMLYRAIEERNGDVARRIIDKGADVNALYNGVSPLMAASRNGMTCIVNYLIVKGANISYKIEGKTALDEAINGDENGEKTYTLYALLKAGAVNGLYQTRSPRLQQVVVTSVVAAAPRTGLVNPAEIVSRITHSITQFADLLQQRHVQRRNHLYDPDHNIFDEDISQIKKFIDLGIDCNILKDGNTLLSYACQDPYDVTRSNDTWRSYDDRTFEIIMMRIAIDNNIAPIVGKKEIIKYIDMVASGWKIMLEAFPMDILRATTDEERAPILKAWLITVLPFKQRLNKLRADSLKIIKLIVKTGTYLLNKNNRGQSIFESITDVVTNTRQREIILDIINTALTKSSQDYNFGVALSYEGEGSEYESIFGAIEDKDTPACLAFLRDAPRAVATAAKNENERALAIINEFVQINNNTYTFYAATGDGNCLFNAISHQMYGDEYHAAEIRQMAVDEILTNNDRFPEALFEEDAEEDAAVTPQQKQRVAPIAAAVFFRQPPAALTRKQAYIENMQNNGEYGGEHEIAALALTLNRTIVVYSYSVDNRAITVNTYGTNRSRAPVTLLHYGTIEHYDSLLINGTDYPLSYVNIEDPNGWIATDAVVEPIRADGLIRRRRADEEEVEENEEDERDGVPIIGVITPLPDTNILNFRGETPLLAACKQGLEPVVARLLEKRTNINAVNKFNQNALEIVLDKFTEENNTIAIRLINKGINITKQNTERETVIFKAAENNFIDVVRRLIQKGIELDDMNFENETVLDAVCKYKKSSRREMIDLLLANGSPPSDLCTARGGALRKIGKLRKSTKYISNLRKSSKNISKSYKKYTRKAKKT